MWHAEAHWVRCQRTRTCGTSNLMFTSMACNNFPASRGFASVCKANEMHSTILRCQLRFLCKAFVWAFMRCDVSRAIVAVAKNACCVNDGDDSSRPDGLGAHHNRCLGWG